jgi:hypothetical protein
LDQEVPGTGLTLRQMIKAYLSPTKDNVSARRILENVMYNTRSNRALALINNIVTDYNIVFNTNFQTLKEVNDWIIERNYTSEKIRSEFAKANVTAYEELHYCPKGPVINQQLIETENAYSSLANFEKILEKQKRLFVKDLLENGFFVNAFLGREGKDLADKYPE